MESAKNGLTVFVVGLALLLMLAFVLITGLSAALASMVGGGSGGPCFGASVPTGTPTPSAGTASSTASSRGTRRPTGTPTTSAPASSCVPPSGYGKQVVAWAQAMASALYITPACHGQISYPNCYDTWYKTAGSNYPPGAPDFPQAMIQYGEQVCLGCAAWANGTYQCVSFVRGAYSQVYPLTLTANAFDLWALYAAQPGWAEIPSAAAPPAARGMPEPGDVMVFKDASIGHVAIVMSVQVPTATIDGSITFSNANSVSPYTTMPLLPDLSVDSSSWPGYAVWGYIRPRTVVTVTPTAHLSNPSLPLALSLLSGGAPSRTKETFFS